MIARNGERRERTCGFAGACPGHRRRASRACGRRVPQAAGHRCARARGGDRRGAVLAAALRSPAPSHRQAALVLAGDALRQRGAALPVGRADGGLPRRVRGEVRDPAPIQRGRAPRVGRRRRRVHRRDRARGSSGARRGDGHRLQPPPQPRTATGRGAVSGSAPACGELPQRRAVRRKERAGRRRGQHRRRDRARARRARRQADAGGAHAGQRRAARLPRPADAGHQHSHEPRADRARRQPGAPDLPPGVRQPGALRARAAAAGSRCRRSSCAGAFR